MSYGICIPSAVQATNNDALIRNARCASAIENGSVVELLTASSTVGEGEVFVATVSAGTITNMWMVGEPPMTITTNPDGTKEYLGINPDVRDFRNAIGKVFSVFKPQVGDIITLSTDAIGGSLNTYAVATSGQAKLQWAAGAVSGLSLKLLTTTKIAIGDGTIAQAGVVAYRFEVVAVA